MARILVSIISEQTIPNLLLMKELSKVDSHVFVTTDEMENRNKSLHLQSAALLQDENIVRCIVQPDSIIDIEAKLAKLKFSDEDNFSVNITCGTKPMAIGVYSFFRNRNSEIFYIDIRKHTFRKIFPLVRHKEKPLRYKLSLKEYLTDYGLVIANEDDIHSLIRKPSVSLGFYKSFLKFTDIDKSFLAELRANRKKKFPLENVELSLLEKWNFKPENSDYLTKHEVKYLTGEWFEEYVYTWMSEFLGLSESQIGTGVQLQKQNGVKNEFDVLFYYNHVLHVIECKTGLWDSAARKNYLNDTIYKLDSLRRDFGLRVKAFIFTMAEKGQERHNIQNYHLDRANLIDVTIVDRSILTNPDGRRKLIKKIKG